MEAFDRSLTRFLENESAYVFICDALLQLLAVGPRLSAHANTFSPGRSLDELFPGQTRELAEARKKLNAGTPFFSTKFEFVPYSSTIYLLPILENGKLSQVLGFLDPSVSSEAMDGLAAVLPGISQQFRAPLSNLLNLLSSIAVQCQLREDYQFLDYLNEAARNCYQMLRRTTMIYDYFMLANKQPDRQPKKLLLNSLLEDICATLRRHLAAVEYKLELQTSGEPIIVSADERLLSLALYHLIANACVYSPKGTTITITLTAYEKSASIAVADDGIGINKQDYDQILQPFFLKHNAPYSEEQIGLGLGLSIVREIVRIQEGRILVTSTLNKGTTIAISLPRTEADEGESSLHSHQRRYLNDRFSDLNILFYSICDMKLY